jgi:hypothetical protein
MIRFEVRPEGRTLLSSVWMLIVLAPVIISSPCGCCPNIDWLQREK